MLNLHRVWNAHPTNNNNNIVLIKKIEFKIDFSGFHPINSKRPSPHSSHVRILPYFRIIFIVFSMIKLNILFLNISNNQIDIII